MEKPIPKILLVDDNPEFIKPLKRYLELHGHSVSTAEDGYSAISRLFSEFHEAVLLDVKLPDVGGMEVLKSIKEINEEIEVIIITGHGSDQAARTFKAAGAFDYLTKPTEYEILLRSIDEALKFHNAQTERNRLKHYHSLEALLPLLTSKIRNPLQTADIALAVIQRRSNTTDKIVLQSFNMIQEELDRLRDIVRESLDFVRRPTKEPFTPVDVNELVCLTADLVSRPFGSPLQAIQVEMRLDPRLPVIRASYDEVKKTLANLVRITFEAMPEEGRLTVATRHHPHPSPGWIEVTIGKPGREIREEDRRDLYSSSLATRFTIAGLGLAVSKKIIEEKHQGKLLIAREEGRGMTVTIKLPVTQPAHLR